MKINLSKQGGGAERGILDFGTMWNFENQPTLFRIPDGSRVTMTYNANNRRVDRE
jgi:YD repeat-containing protein